MTAAQPTILATSGGFVAGPRQVPEVGALLRYAMDLSRVPEPKVCFVNTAQGDDSRWQYWAYAALAAVGARPTHLSLYTMPNVPDITAHLTSCDVIWVNGGSVANLLALWRLHGVDTAMRAAWEAGVVLSGVSAGSLCWHAGGNTDSFGPQLRAVTNGLGFLPHANAPHYDAEPERRPLTQRLIAEGTLPDGYATDNGAGLLYRGTDLVQCVAERDDAYCWQVRRDGDRALDPRLETRLLSW